MMWVLMRAVTWSTLFIGFVLVFMPARVLSWSGITPILTIGLWQVVGMVMAAAGAAIALWGIATFVHLGKGTPAPFDPPRRLVVRGPYRFVRNPMYVGAALALVGAALSYQSLPLLGYAALLGLMVHAFVVLYEEPTLRRTFDGDYEAYCASVGRWLPKRTTVLLLVLCFAVATGTAGAQGATPQGRQAILDYQLTLPKANHLITAMEKDPAAMAILKENSLTPREYAVGVPALRMALMAAHGMPLGRTSRSRQPTSRSPRRISRS